MGDVKKCGGGVRKCVADVGEGLEKWRGGKIWGRCGKVFCVWEKVKRDVGKCVGVWGSNGGEV